MTIDRLPLAELGEDASALLHTSSLLASPGFLRVWETVGGKPVLWIAHESGRTLAILPAVEFRSAPFTRLQAMPDGLYLRLIRPEVSHSCPESQHRLLARILSHGYARIYLTDYYRELGETVRMSVAMHSTQLIELTRDWEPPDPKLRSEIRKAEREGATGERFDATKHMSGFLELMKATETRHGRKPKYPDRFFAALAELAAQDSRIKWYYLAFNGRPVVSHICLTEGEIALNWQIYYDKQFSSLKGNQLMLYHAARQLQSEGVRYLSLGASPHDAEGVKTFKEKWGGITAAYPCFEHRSLLGRLL